LEIVTKYISDVLTGRILACEYVKNACIRFNADLKREDIKFSEQHYLYCAKLIENLTHTVGEKAGENFILEPWQHFIVANIFGFLKPNGTRRYTRAYVELPRKNGKSTFAAAIMLFGLIADGEEGAQIYSAATKLDQAMMVFGEAYRMVTKNKIFAGHLKSANSIHNRYVSKENSIFKPLEWNPKKQDGLNAHFCCIDEYHAHLSDEMYNVMRNSMGARSQPLLFTITTAGFNKESPCYRHRKYCTKVLDSSIQDDALFAIIYTLDKDDNWQDPKNWQKANPNWGVSVNPRILEEGLSEAKEMPHKEVEFKTKLLNVWTDSATTWVSDDLWNACGTDDNLAIGECYGGLDLATVSDFCAYSLYFPETKYCKTFYFIPEDSLNKRNDQSGESIREWVLRGNIIATPGNVTDYDYIRSKINDLALLYGRPMDIAFDPYNSSQLVIQLQDDGFKMYKYRQGFISMSKGTKELERLITGKEFKHDNNPVCRWMMANILIVQDAAGNIKIDKQSSNDKVDGPVSKVMAIGTWIEENMDKEVPQEFFVYDL
jgi:phage terminase large subunit-like protein